MPFQVRSYDPPRDYQLVSGFLIHNYQPGNADGNWLEHTWEYMRGHPYLDGASLEKTGLQEENGRLELGKAAVLEGIRRCSLLGAATAYVGSDQAFYQALGFQKCFTSECWMKNF